MPLARLARDLRRPVAGRLDALEVVLALPERLVGGLQASVGLLRPRVHPARRRTDLVREPGGRAEVDAVQEPFRLAGKVVHLLRRVLDHAQAVHAHLGVVHRLPEQAGPGVRYVRDALREVLHLLEHLGEEAALAPPPPGPLVVLRRLVSVVLPAARAVPAAPPLTWSAPCGSLGRQERSEHLREELPALARPDPAVDGRGVHVLAIVLRALPTAAARAVRRAAGDRPPDPPAPDRERRPSTPGRAGRRRTGGSARGAPAGGRAVSPPCRRAPDRSRLRAPRPSPPPPPGR